ELKTILEVTFPIARGDSQFAHDNNQVILYRENLVRNELIWRNGTGEAERGAQLIDASIGVHARIGFRQSPSVHQRRFAFVASFSDDGHEAKCRVFDSPAPARSPSALRVYVAGSRQLAFRGTPIS